MSGECREWEGKETGAGWCKREVRLVSKWGCGGGLGGWEGDGRVGCVRILDCHEYSRDWLRSRRRSDVASQEKER